MSCQHKRPGRTARLKRLRSLPEFEAKRQERARRRAAIVVHIPAQRKRYDDIYPGRCVAWADGGKTK